MRDRDFFYNPVRTIYGLNASQILPDLLSKAGAKRVLALAYHERVFEGEVFKKVKDSGPFDLQMEVFDRPGPTIQDLFFYYEKTKILGPDIVVGIGGGPVMDIGKSLCLTYGYDFTKAGDLRKRMEEKDPSPRARWIGIPTTAGTGSEVTSWATIWDPEKGKKRSFQSEKNYAYAAIVDPALLSGQPLSTAAGCAIDALAQSVESYWSKRSNLISRTYALTAIRKIRKGLANFFEDRAPAYKEISKGSLLSGLAFSNTQTTACHALSYPLTLYFKIPHGLAVGYLLAPVMAFNEESIEGKEELFDALKITSVEDLSAFIKGILIKAGLPPSLKDWGVGEKDILSLALQAETPGIFDNNPVDLSQEEVKEIFNMAL